MMALKKKPKLSATERQAAKVKRDHIRLVRECFTSSGFIRVAGLEGKQFTFKGSTCDFDDVYVLENVVVLTEYTAHNEQHVSDHLKKKKIIFDKITDNTAEFTTYATQTFPVLKTVLSALYAPHQLRVIVVYCSRYALNASTKEEVPCVTYLDYIYAKYFQTVASTVKRSSRFELLDFLGVAPAQFGSDALKSQSSGGQNYPGLVLPEAQSHYPVGFKVVSFYVDAAALLQRSYVLRRDGWRAGANLYQRMIVRNKIEAIRSHLVSGKGVFANNIIVTLPSDTKLTDEDQNTIPPEKIVETGPCRITLPTQYSSIGIIDGQHRVFSYHEGGSHEAEVSKLRLQQNLLVTGIVFPSQMTAAAKMRFEANLFLEINSNQTNAKSDLKQEIGLILHPFSAESIAKRVVNHINDTNGPLNNQFERFFFDRGKLKTTTVVSYGLKLLVRPGHGGTLFSAWHSDQKPTMVSAGNDAALAEYIDFCVKQINQFVSAAKARIDHERWTASRKIEGRVLTTTTINGFLSCMRHIARKDELADFNSYFKALAGLNEFGLSGYKSSQYNVLGAALYNKFFAKSCAKTSQPLE